MCGVPFCAGATLARVSKYSRKQILMLHIIWSIIIGFIVGWLAEVLYPGAQHLGFWKAALVGIGGSVLGGLIGRLFSKPEPGSSFHAAGFLMSLVGALIILFICIKFQLL
jgi:uncharacterized membrane protein YeaQ/YmgE (transglycosylase-associated protein family)